MIPCKEGQGHLDRNFRAPKHEKGLFLFIHMLFPSEERFKTHPSENHYISIMLHNEIMLHNCETIYSSITNNNSWMFLLFSLSSFWYLPRLEKQGLRFFGHDPTNTRCPMTCSMDLQASLDQDFPATHGLSNAQSTCSSHIAIKVQPDIWGSDSIFQGYRKNQEKMIDHESRRSLCHDSNSSGLNWGLCWIKRPAWTHTNVPSGPDSWFRPCYRCSSKDNHYIENHGPIQ